MDANLVKYSSFSPNRPKNGWMPALIIIIIGGCFCVFGTPLFVWGNAYLIQAQREDLNVETKEAAAIIGSIFFKTGCVFMLIGFILFIASAVMFCKYKRSCPDSRGMVLSAPTVTQPEQLTVI